MNKIFKFTIIIVLTFCSFNCWAQSDDERSIRKFFLKIQSVMNSKQPQDLKSFFNYYIDESAKFIKASYLISPEDNNKIIAEENLSMSKSEYIKYLLDIINPLSYYYYKVDIQNIDFDDDSKIALISYTVDEYSINKSSFQNKSPKNDPNSDVAYVRANCNMNLNLEAGNTIILSSNCAEKIIRKKEYHE